MNYDEVKEDLKNYYANLLIVQYNGKPKAVATIKMYVDAIMADMLIFKIRDAFDVDTATGEQLDFIGKWVGIDRFFSGQLFEGQIWFSMLDADILPNPQQGSFQDVEDLTPLDGAFLSADDILGNLNVLDDENFRFLIKLKIIKNNINHTCKEIDNNIFKIFNGDTYTTWEKPMELTYNYASHRETIINLARDKGALPMPTAVNLNLRMIA